MSSQLIPELSRDGAGGGSGMSTRDDSYEGGETLREAIDAAIDKAEGGKE